MQLFGEGRSVAGSKETDANEENAININKLE